MKKKLIKMVKKVLQARTIKRAGLFFIGLVLILFFSYAGYAYAYRSEFYPGIRIGSLNLGGLTIAEAKDKLAEKINNAEGQNIKLVFEDQTWDLSSLDLKLQYDLDKTVSTLFDYGHRSSYWTNFWDITSLFFHHKNFLISFSYDKNVVDEKIAVIKNTINVPMREAGVEINNGQVKVTPEQAGRLVGEEQLRQEIVRTLGEAAVRGEIKIEITTINPSVTEENVAQEKSKIEKIISFSLTLKSDYGDFEITNETIGSWLELAFKKEKNDIRLMYLFNQDKIKNFVGVIAQEIDKEPKDAKLTISHGRATVFQSSSDGRKLDKNLAVAGIEKILSDVEKGTGPGVKELKLVVNIKEPTVSNDTINDLGIKELVGLGTTNFYGSPENRRYNIVLGASFFNGALIKPGEEFSFMHVLGNVTEERGFRKELVIKEDRTEPEVGGGLCQVSTTMFRAALNSGMEIVERRNHRYRVSYYEPPIGMDATIYDPSPDFKFKNNTLGYILIQSKVLGNNITFEFYGTKDGRKVEISDPIAYDYVDPEEPVYIDDSSLAPGEVKQKERAHQGMKASFHYKVIDKDGEVLTETTFYSTYVPWQAVYLRGPEILEPTPSPSPTPTPSPSPTISS